MDKGEGICELGMQTGGEGHGEWMGEAMGGHSERARYCTYQVLWVYATCEPQYPAAVNNGATAITRPLSFVWGGLPLLRAGTGGAGMGY